MRYFIGPQEESIKLLFMLFLSKSFKSKQTQVPSLGPSVRWPPNRLYERIMRKGGNKIWQLRGVERGGLTCSLCVAYCMQQAEVCMSQNL